MSVAERYRSLPRTQRVLWVVGPLAILAGIGLAVWFGLAATVGKPVWGDLTYGVKDDRTMGVTYQLTRPSDRVAHCIVVAKDINHATVGRLDDVVPAGGGAHQVRTVDVRTTSRAVMGHVERCTLE